MSASRPALERLEALPPNRFHLRLVGTLAVAVAAGGAALPKGAGAPIDLLVVPAIGLGALAGGAVADRLGRRATVLGGLLAVLAGLVGGLLATPVLALAATGLGALATVAAAFISESSSSRSRALLVLAVVAATGAGALLPAYAGIPLALVALVAWRGLAESPSWLLARGRSVEADAVVRRAERASGAPAISLARVAPVPPQRAGVGDLLRPTLAVAVALGFAAGLLVLVHLTVAAAASIVAALGPGSRGATLVRGIASGSVVAAAALGVFVALRAGEAAVPAMFVAAGLILARLVLEVVHPAPLGL